VVAVDRVVNSQHERGFSVLWQTTASPTELLAQCAEPERARAETDVVVVDPKSSNTDLELELEDYEAAHRALSEVSIRQKIIQFNAPFWSLTLWPLEDGELFRQVEFCGSAYTDALEGMLSVSADQEIVDQIKKVADEMRRATSLLLEGAPESSRRVSPRNTAPPAR
jgi:hypothetical protein